MCQQRGINMYILYMHVYVYIIETKRSNLENTYIL